VFGKAVEAEGKFVAYARGGDLEMNAIRGHSNHFHAVPSHARFFLEMLIAECDSCKLSRMTRTPRCGGRRALLYGANMVRESTEQHRRNRICAHLLERSACLANRPLRRPD
jgi:hypothetical protein